MSQDLVVLRLVRGLLVASRRRSSQQMKHCFGSKSRAWIHIPSPSCQSSGVSQTKSPGLEPQHQILFPCQIHCHNLIFSYLVSTQHQVRPQLRSEATATLNFSSTDSILYFCQHRGITKKKNDTSQGPRVCVCALVGSGSESHVKKTCFQFNQERD